MHSVCRLIGNLRTAVDQYVAPFWFYGISVHEFYLKAETDGKKQGILLGAKAA